MKVQDLRKSYTKGTLDESDLPENPFVLFNEWFTDITRKGTTPFDKLKYKISEWLIGGEDLEANAMTLSTVDNQGNPNSRTVLMKDIGENYIEFFTNYDSTKGKELINSKFACVTFWWPPLQRQVIMRGNVEKSPDERNDEYFKTRPRESQIGAWASEQSKVIPNRKWIEDRKRMTELAFEKYNEGEITRPDNWGGFRIFPSEIEFWQGRVGRLHDRIRYRDFVNFGWEYKRLSS
jgi:pyridoxamine 5'-phosphate oxidase